MTEPEHCYPPGYGHRPVDNERDQHHPVIPPISCTGEMAGDEPADDGQRRRNDGRYGAHPDMPGNVIGHSQPDMDINIIRLAVGSRLFLRLILSCAVGFKKAHEDGPKIGKIGRLHRSKGIMLFLSRHPNGGTSPDAKTTKVCSIQGFPHADMICCLDRLARDMIPWM
jgi:hypothetical protein